MDFSSLELDGFATTLAIIPMVLFFLLGFGLGCLVSARCLHQAVVWLRFKPLPFWTAFRLVILINGVLLMFSLSIGFNYGLVSQLFSPDSSRLRSNAILDFSSIFQRYQIFLNLVISSAILSRFVLPADEESTSRKSVGFVDYLALSSVYFGLVFATHLLVAVVVGGGIAIIISLL